MENNIVTHKQLIDLIEQYCSLYNLTTTEFGGKYFNDTGVVPRLRKGRDPRLSTVIKIINIVTGRL